jgi:hypothetical protein
LSADGSDATVLEQQLTDQLRTAAGADKSGAAAAMFAGAHPVPDGLFDLGTVTPEAAQAAGYACIAT